MAAIILLLFLRSFGATATVSLAIPVSVIGSFVALAALGRSINVISLAGIAFAVGMVVDAAIVVLENIQRHREKGFSALESARQGTSEVGRAVIAATLTTVCVFAPLVFVEGVAGQLFRDQALTVAYSLVASLFVALMLIPMLASLALKLVSEEETDGGGAFVRVPAQVVHGTKNNSAKPARMVIIFSSADRETVMI